MAKIKKSDADRVLNHALALQRIFPKAKNTSPLDLYARLHRLEAEAHTFAEKCCNEDVPEDKQTRKDASILARLDAILGFKNAGIKIVLNGDPRGCVIKIDDACMREKNIELHRDWGGYGIIAPY